MSDGKTCNGCKVFLPYSMYHGHKGAPDGYQYKCKQCMLVWQRQYRKDNPAIFAAQYQRHKQHESDRSRWRRYGITAEQYAAMLAGQSGLCALADDTCSTGQHLSVDHDHRCCPSVHTCGKCLRGLLCRKHNVGLGSFSDNPSKLRQAADYLDKWRVDHSKRLEDNPITA